MIYRYIFGIQKNSNQKCPYFFNMDKYKATNISNMLMTGNTVFF